MNVEYMRYSEMLKAECSRPTPWLNSIPERDRLNENALWCAAILIYGAEGVKIRRADGDFYALDYEECVYYRLQRALYERTLIEQILTPPIVRSPHQTHDVSAGM